MRFPTVICAVCQKSVDYMEIFDRFDRHVQVLRVRCHGEWDEMELQDSDIIKMSEVMLHQINEGVGFAFTKPRIATKEKAPDQ